MNIAIIRTFVMIRQYALSYSELTARLKTVEGKFADVYEACLLYTSDTLIVDYKKLNQEDACNHPCKCNYPLESVKFNGIAAIVDTTIKEQQVYLFNKE